MEIKTYYLTIPSITYYFNTDNPYSYGQWSLLLIVNNNSVVFT